MGARCDRHDTFGCGRCPLLDRVEELRAELEQVKGERDRERSHADIAVRERDTVEAECERYREALGGIRWRAEEAIRDCPVKHRGTVPYTALAAAELSDNNEFGCAEVIRALATHGPEGE